MAPEAEPTPVGHTVSKATGYGAPAMPPTAEEHGGDLPGGFRREDVEATEDSSGAEGDGDPSELKGEALDAELDRLGIAKTGTADEKRAKIAEKRAEG